MFTARGAGGRHLTAVHAGGSGLTAVCASGSSLTARGDSGRTLIARSTSGICLTADSIATCCKMSLCHNAIFVLLYRKNKDMLYTFNSHSNITGLHGHRIT